MLPFDLPKELWFRSEMDQAVYRAIRKIKMGTIGDILAALDLRPGTGIGVHLRNLQDMDLIHIVGHYGGNARAVYALLYKQETS